MPNTLWTSWDLLAHVADKGFFFQASVGSVKATLLFLSENCRELPAHDSSSSFII
ncbi:hypothetical protein QQ045_031706 [Rhodiola kirilowii]